MGRQEHPFDKDLVEHPQRDELARALAEMLASKRRDALYTLTVCDPTTGRTVHVGYGVYDHSGVKAGTENLIFLKVQHAHKRVDELNDLLISMGLEPHKHHRDTLAAPIETTEAGVDICLRVLKEYFQVPSNHWLYITFILNWTDWPKPVLALAGLNSRATADAKRSNDKGAKKRRSIQLADAKRCFRAAVAPGKSPLGGVELDHAVRAALTFYAETEVAGCSTDADGDMLLYQWDVVNTGRARALQIYLTRQLMPDPSGEPYQLSLTYSFHLDQSPKRLTAGNKWCHSLSELPAFRRFIERSAPYRHARVLTPSKVRLTFDRG